MVLHIVKLSVGSQSVEDLEQWVELRLKQHRAIGLAQEHIHTTRMVPKRRDEVLDGGSIYWVIKGFIQCRQKFIDIRTYKNDEGKNCCDFVLEPRLIPTRVTPRRAFQGWRYFKADDAPPDLTQVGEGDDEMPDSLRLELGTLGLL